MLFVLPYFRQSRFEVSHTRIVTTGGGLVDRVNRVVKDNMLAGLHARGYRDG
jgi:hypothetical protein